MIAAARPACGTALLLALLVFACARCQAQEYLEEFDAALLAENDLPVEPEALRRFLNPRPLSAEDRRRIQEDIRALATPEFLARQEATERLADRGAAALPAVREALASRDAEVRFRARHLILRIEQDAGRDVSLRHAVLRVIARRKLSGLLATLCDLVPQAPAEYDRAALLAALRAAARPEDAALLAEILDSSPHVEARAAALAALAELPGDAVGEELARRLGDTSPHVQLAAASCLFARGEAASLPVLVALLESDDVRLRLDAAQLLHAASSDAFDFAAGDPPERREAAVTRWKAWLAARDAAAPLPKLLPPALPPRLLLCHFNPFSVSEYTFEGRKTWASTSLQSACGCQGTAEGERIFADWGAGRLIAYDNRGVETLRIELPGTPNGLERLAGGNLLVPLFDKRHVIEYEPSGRVAWEATVAGAPTDARKLPNGRVLIPFHDSDRLVEIDLAGEITWEVKDIPAPESARRMANGNTLVACNRGGQVIEVDPAGRIVWRYEDVPNAYDALELPCGTLLIGFGGGLREVDRGGTTVREINTTTVRRICAY